MATCSSAKQASYAHCRYWLESGGWLRQVAGDADFGDAVLALQAITDKPSLGLIVSGDPGCGKTKLIEAITRNRAPFRINLGLTEDLEKLTPAYLLNFAVKIFERDIFLDDLGAEKGPWKDPVGDFIVRWHFRRKPNTRLWITTNYNGEQMMSEINARVYDRCKDLVYPLRLNGKSKRVWVNKTPPKTPDVSQGDWEPQGDIMNEL